MSSQPGATPVSNPLSSQGPTFTEPGDGDQDITSRLDSLLASMEATAKQIQDATSEAASSSMVDATVNLEAALESTIASSNGSEQAPKPEETQPVEPHVAGNPPSDKTIHPDQLLDADRQHTGDVIYVMKASESLTLNQTQAPAEAGLGGDSELGVVSDGSNSIEPSDPANEQPAVASPAASHPELKIAATAAPIDEPNLPPAKVDLSVPPPGIIPPPATGPSVLGSIEALDAQLAKLSDELAQSELTEPPVVDPEPSPAVAADKNPALATHPHYTSAPSPTSAVAVTAVPAAPQAPITAAVSAVLPTSGPSALQVLGKAVKRGIAMIEPALLRMLAPLGRPLATQLPAARLVIALAAIYSLALGGWAAHYAFYVRPGTFMAHAATAFNLKSGSFPHPPDAHAPAAAGHADAKAGDHGADAHGSKPGASAGKGKKPPAKKSDAKAKKAATKKPGEKGHPEAKGGH